MKAQMFVVTMVFLVGLIFTVQQIFFQYRLIDLPLSSQGDDSYLTESIKDSYQETVLTVTNCASLNASLQRLEAFLLQNAGKGGYSVELGHEVHSCTPSTANVSLDIRLLGAQTETKSTYQLIR